MRFKCRIGIHEWVVGGIARELDGRLYGDSLKDQLKFRAKVVARDQICAYCEKIELNATKALEKQFKEDQEEEKAVEALAVLRAKANIKLKRFIEMKRKADD